MNRLRDAAAIGILAVIASCSYDVAPEEPSIQAIVLTVPPTMGAVLQEVNRVHVRLTRPLAVARDTVLAPVVGTGQVRARAILRPNESQPGTTIEVDLKNHATFLFRGSIVIGPDSGWPNDVRVPVVPLATFDAGPDRVVALGDVIDLAQTATIRFGDGPSMAPEDVAWLSTDASILEMTGASAQAVGVGQAAILGVWYGQIDTVAVEVRPTGTIYVSASEGTYYLGAGDVAIDSVDVTQDAVGDVGRLTANVSSSFPSLTASLASDTPPTRLTIGVDGSAAPEGGSPGEIVLSSSRAGIDDVVIRVNVYKDPSDAEVRTWDRFCVIGDRLGSGYEGQNGCMSIRAKSWIDGDSKRVVLEARNLFGALGDSLDTASRFEVFKWGLLPPTPGTPSYQLLDVRPMGSVNVMGTPTLSTDGAPGFTIRVRPNGGTLIGCSTQGNYQTCDALGYDGLIRADLLVTDTAWAFADLTPLMDVRIGSRVLINCGLDMNDACVVVR